MDLEKQRKINEIKNQLENQSVINSYGTNTAKWQYSLRKEEPSLKQLVPSKSANNIMGQDQQKIIIEPPKRKSSFKLQNDLPNGFRTSGQSFHLRQIEQVRNPFSITSNNFFNSVRSKSELKPHETKHNFYSKDFIDKQQRQFEPEFENLYIAGKSQYEKEIEMLENTKQNYFRQQLQEKDQNFGDSKNDQEIIAEVYDTKTRAKKLQLDEIQSEHQSLIYSKNHSLYKPYQSEQQKKKFIKNKKENKINDIMINPFNDPFFSTSKDELGLYSPQIFQHEDIFDSEFEDANDEEYNKELKEYKLNKKRVMEQERALRDKYRKKQQDLFNKQQQQMNQQIQQQQDSSNNQMNNSNYVTRSETMNSYLNDKGQRVVVSKVILNDNGKKQKQINEKVLDQNNNVISDRNFNTDKEVADYVNQRKAINN
ncbi:hypothetical protein PPERSA_08242 [Pseudocohnilembus persalinus]|uniref:Uncharacterized protein n=1 Tax=Pseudocohnilembus persalinus TaxID=266149 RepID=A0A0V0QGD6_PSEPJ|nr:hypothetical protein PPERSA_08242 [Pseudocohnilembus persalinus]|eukprot:KRX01141.1 hypothetical protein PPERSA_08242 [Pseudocohnilembus persalinus]